MSDGSPEERATTTKRISSEDQEAEAADHLDNTVDASGEELDVVTDKTESLEDLGRVVVDGVGTGHLLADHEANGDESTLAVTGDGEHLLEKVLDGGTGDEHALVLELIGNILDFTLDVLVRDGQIAHAGKDAVGLLPAVLLGQETGRLLVEGHAADKENCREGLKGKRDDVDRRAAGQVQKRSVVDPEGKAGSGGNEKLVKTGQTTTNGTGSILRDVKRDDHGGTTNTDTSDETTNVHGLDVTRGDSLDDAADNGDKPSHLQGDLTSPLVGEPGVDEATDEATGLESRGDVGVQVGLCCLGETGEFVLAASKVSHVLLVSWLWATYAWNSGNSRTPPMVPISNPNNMPPKQADPAMANARHP